MPLAPPQSYRKVQQIHRVGLAANKPNAANVLVGTLYFSTDTGVLERSNGTTWDLYASVGSGTVAPHHTTHEPGGTDVLVNAAWLNQPNVFTKLQTIDPGTGGGGFLRVIGRDGEGGIISLSDMTAPADRKLFYIRSQGGGVNFQSLTDVGGAYAQYSFYNGVLLIRPPTGAAPAIALSKDISDSDLSYPKLVGEAGALELKRYDNAARVQLLASGLGDTPLNASQLTSGTVPDARLSTNVQMKPVPPTTPTAHHTTHEPGGADALVNAAWTNVDNHFTAGQTIPGIAVNSAGWSVSFSDPSSPVNGKYWRFIGYSNGNFYLDSLTDALNAYNFQYVFTPGGVLTCGAIHATAVGNQLADLTLLGATNFTNGIAMSGGAANLTGPLTVSGATVINNATTINGATILNGNVRQGLDPAGGGGLFTWYLESSNHIRAAAGLYDYGRTNPIGVWTAVPYNAANFYAQAGMIWTVTAAQVTVNRYTLIGKTLLWNVLISASAIGGTLGTYLAMNIPSGFTMAGVQSQISGTLYLNNSAWQACLVSYSGGAVLNIYRYPYTTVMEAGNTYVSFQIYLELA